MAWMRRFRIQMFASTSCFFMINMEIFDPMFNSLYYKFRSVYYWSIVWLRRMAQYSIFSCSGWNSRQTVWRETLWINKCHVGTNSLDRMDVWSPMIYALSRFNVCIWTGFDRKSIKLARTLPGPTRSHTEESNFSSRFNKAIHQRRK